MRALRAPGGALLLVLLVAMPRDVAAADLVGQVIFTGLPVPGATITATQGERRVSTATDPQGIYRFPELSDGIWSVQVEMAGFAPVRLDQPSSATAEPVVITLTLLSFEALTQTLATSRADTVASTALPSTASDRPGSSAPAAPGRADALAAPVPSTLPLPTPPSNTGPGDENAAGAADGLLINGSVNNGAASPFAQAAAFGNNRPGQRTLYNGGVGLVLGNSAWDARPYSFTGVEARKPSYDDMQFLGTFGGPLRIPRLVRNRPSLFLGYQRLVEHTASTESALVPSLLERSGDFSHTRDAAGRLVTVSDPSTGAPFGDSVIPPDRLSAQALALLAYYPRPNVAAAGRYNYQAPLLTATHQDSAQTRLTYNLDTRNQLFTNITYQRTRIDTTSLFGFDNANRTSNLDAAATWTRRMSVFLSTRLRYQLTRTASRITPHFANTTNVSGDAGIAGTDQAPENWGPPSLTFSSGLLGLADAQASRSAATTHAVTGEGIWNRPRHSITIGGSVRHTQLDVVGQQNGRGSFAFTGIASGVDVADFLLGLPQAAAIAVGNADKFLSASGLDAYVADDWRVSPSLTVNAGLRWEYDSPMRERLGRLANLDLAPGFAAASAVTPDAPVGTLTGRHYPDALLLADRSGLQPRIGVAWRPIPGSSLVMRAGYGIYRNTNTYQPIALLMAQQPPFSHALSVETSAANPLTLADAFLTIPTGTGLTFAADPAFRVGSAQNWQWSVQRDLPASLTMSVSYLGTHGRHLLQESLPNTYPTGAINPCPTCPAGFVYLTSNASSTRHAGQFQLRRRLRNGLTATTQYTLSKSTDDSGAFTGAALSGAAVAQDWRDLDGERGPSNFDQRHLLTAQLQYTTGVGVRGGGLLTGMKGTLVKGWTVTSQLTAGTGLPLTPIVLTSVAGTGVTGTIRGSHAPRVRGSIPDGRYLDPDAYVVPAAGEWGDVGRNSGTGPGQFALSAGIARSFPRGDRLTFDWRLDASNVLNRVTYSAVSTVVGSPQFGLPTRANPMRKIQTSLRLRF